MVNHVSYEASVRWALLKHDWKGPHCFIGQLLDVHIPQTRKHVSHFLPEGASLAAAAQSWVDEGAEWEEFHGLIYRLTYI